MYLGFNCCFYYILRSIDVRLNAFHWVVLGHRDMFQGGCMYHVVNSTHSYPQPTYIANITYEVSHLWEIVFSRHFSLFQFVPREDHHSLGLVAGEDSSHVLSAKGAGTARYENCLSIQHWINDLVSLYLSGRTIELTVRL